MQLLGSHAKSARESALRVAEENGITNGKLLELGKAKAQSLFSQVQESVASKRGPSTRRSSSAKKIETKSPGKAGKGVYDEELIAKIMEIGVSPVAARLALSKCEGIDKKHQSDVACNWLLEEKNREEIEAAENAEVEKSAADDMTPSKEVSRDASCGESEEPVFVLARSPAGRRVSKGSDDGRGLGFFMSRRSLSQPSPRAVPHPGRLSRGRVSTGSVDSGVGDSRPSLARRVSNGSQTSTASEEFQPAMTPRGDETEGLEATEDGTSQAETGVARCDGDTASPKECEGEASVGGDAACGDEDEPEIEEDEEEDDEEASAPLLSDPVPPHSQCWDWPLSRHEKKARVQMLERRMNAMDRSSLVKECKLLRTDLRKASLGGTSTRPSRLST